ncbi:MAG: hypothetical protein E6Q24_18975 [Chitinophagaceae bacterium]|nr:MAG: hypothetical protein E6Q24_18975 [Chitinophagaceae bacterium]
MASCIICGSYTKFEKGLCYDCYYDKENRKALSTGMTDREYHFRFSMIKGRIAETLIQELFLALRYKVFKYGMENTIPGIMELLQGVESPEAKEISSMPDLVVQNPKTKLIHFIEVKFRADGNFRREDLAKEYPWKNAFIVVVSKKHIKCVSFVELERGVEITPTSKNYLGDRKEFETDRSIIIEFCEFALDFFESV